VTCIREEVIDESVRDSLLRAVLTENEGRALRKLALAYQAHWGTKRDELHESFMLQRQNVERRLSHLTDAFLNGDVDKPLFDDKRRSLIFERKQMDEEIASLDTGQWSVPAQVLNHLELCQTLPLSYETALVEEKRDIVAKLTSNLSADGKNLVIRLRSPFQDIALRHESQPGGPFRTVPRTGTSHLARLFQSIVAHVSALQEHLHDAETCQSGT